MKIHIIASEEEIATPAFIKATDALLGFNVEFVSNPEEAELIIIKSNLITPTTNRKIQIIGNIKVEYYTSWNNYLYRNFPSECLSEHNK
jgi:hypothetical protein